MVVGVLLNLAAAVVGTTAWNVAQPVDGSTHTLPRPSVVVLWATWCIPCDGELKRLPSLTKAAAPLPVVTLALDPPRKALMRLRARGRATRDAFADARDPGTVLAAWGGGGAKLPLAVAIDRNGAVCGAKQGLLGTDQLKEWATTCLR